MLDANQVYLRDYNRIFTGTNQNDGFENPFLCFTSDTIEIIFKSDKSTYFHYPKTSEFMYLSSTDLIESGAIAGSIPFKSDRIFKKHANYQNDTPWGASYPVENRKGVWLCTWLSGNDANYSQTPVWMDRWYDPGSMDITLSMFVSNANGVYDEPTRLTFDPGVWYRYDHIGSTSNNTIVDMICGLKSHPKNWSNDVILDITNFNNNVYVQNYTSSCKTKGVDENETGLTLNGINQYGILPYNDNFNVDKNISCNIWIKSTDWINQSAHHFLSNGLRGGWQIGINNGFFTPYNLLIDKSGNIIFNNKDGIFYKDMVLPGTSSPIKIVIDSELYAWVLDNGIYDNQKHLYKIDYNGNVDNMVSFSSDINLSDVVIDKDNLIWVTDSNIISAFDSYCNIVSTSNISGMLLAINNASYLTAVNAEDVCFFENTLWTIENGNIYYNISSFERTCILESLSASNIKCTNEHVWALFDTNKIIQFEKIIDPITYDISFIQGISGVLSDDIVNEKNERNLFFTNEFINGSNINYVWILQPNTEYLYKFDTSLNLIKKINITSVEHSILNGAVRGDSSGYDWHNSFNYSALVSANAPQIEASVYLRTNTNILTSQKFTTIIPISSLSQNDWHMFTLSIDNDNNELRFYMDAMLHDSVSIPVSSSIYYKYETSLSLGTNMGQVDIIEKEIKDSLQLYHTGAFDDLRIYTSLLNNSDIRHIYLSKFDFNDLHWNMQSGIQSYIEEIVRFFKFKMPGQKSQYYNIRLRGLNIYDRDVQIIIENIIKESIKKIAPLYTSLYKIEWD